MVSAGWGLSWDPGVFVRGMVFNLSESRFNRTCAEAQILHCSVLQVQLARQMEKSAKEFGEWRKSREKEVMQLRRQVSTVARICLSSTTVPHH